MPTLLVFGARNLGRVLSRDLAADGWRVAAVARSQQTIEKLHDEVPAAVGLIGDASDPDDVEHEAIERGVDRRVALLRVAVDGRSGCTKPSQVEIQPRTCAFALSCDLRAFALGPRLGGGMRRGAPATAACERTGNREKREPTQRRR